MKALSFLSEEVTPIARAPLVYLRRSFPECFIVGSYVRGNNPVEYKGKFSIEAKKWVGVVFKIKEILAKARK